MRRLLLVPVLAVALAVSGCGTSSGPKKTVTVVNTITSSAATGSVSGSGSAPSLTVVGSPNPSVSGSPTATASTRPSSSPATTTSVSKVPIVKVDPLQASCPNLLSSPDIKKAIGATVGTKSNRIRLGAADRGVTGAIRCLYGSTDSGKTAPVRIRLTQYNTAAAAKKQVGVDVQASLDGGATVTNPVVGGYPAALQLLAGAVIEMQYDTWTLSVAVSDKLASAAMLTSGMPVLANQVLVRVIKNG